MAEHSCLADVEWCVELALGGHTFAIGIDGLSLAVAHLGLEGRCADCGEGKSTGRDRETPLYHSSVLDGGGRESAIVRVGGTIDGIDEIVG